LLSPFTFFIGLKSKVKVMKKSLLFFIQLSIALFALQTTLVAQVPQLFNYQGIARDAGGNVLPNHKIGVQLSVLDGGPAGTVVYTETFTDTTNAFGLFSMPVGGGNVTSGSFSGINWATGNKYLQTSIDLSGGTSYALSGTTQLLSVPYALYAGKAVVGVGNGSWNLNGNTGSADSNFIGTTDTIPFTVRVNDSLSGKIDPVSFNSFWGYQSGSSALTGSENTAIGYQTLNGGGSGSFNTAVGSEVLVASNSGSNNTAVGHSAMRSNSTGVSNTALGFGTLTDNTTGAENSAGGYFSMFHNTTGNFNTAFGWQALQNNTTGNDNTAIGREALSSNQTGYGNVAVGTRAMVSNVYGKQLIAIGDSAMFNFQGLDFNGNTRTYNIAIGAMALFNNTLGNENIAIGFGAVQANIDGIQNVAMGTQALTANTHGLFNIGLGSAALAQNTTGNNNTAVGNISMFWNTTGNNNVAVGDHAFSTNFTVDKNFGSDNTALGDSADISVSGLNNATAIGFKAMVDASNKVRIGNTDVTVIEGQVPFTTPSDGRFKFNVREDVKGLDFILKLRPVTYQFNAKKQEDFMRGVTGGTPVVYDEATMMRRTGFIAQEVEKAAVSSGYDFDGLKVPHSGKEYYSLSYASFVVPLVKAVQEQQGTIRQQQVRIDELSKQVEELRQMVLAVTKK
jgi:trimeric autotransporter adhesin